MSFMSCTRVLPGINESKILNKADDIQRIHHIFKKFELAKFFHSVPFDRTVCGVLAFHIC